VYTLTGLKIDTRLWVTHLDGDHSLPHAHEFFKQLEQRRDPQSSHPLLATDGWRGFQTAILELYGREEPVPGIACQGKTKTHLVLPPDLGYVRIQKIRQGQRVVRIERQIVFGHPGDVSTRLKMSGTGTINTSYVERFNGTIRHCLARFIRRTLNFSKQVRMHAATLNFLQAWYNFVRPHHSLRLPNPDPHKKWVYQTPAMAEGLTNHKWTLDELLSFRVPVQS
jgi:hypothetical protein